MDESSQHLLAQDDMDATAATAGAEMVDGDHMSISMSNTMNESSYSVSLEQANQEAGTTLSEMQGLTLPGTPDLDDSMPLVPKQKLFSCSWCQRQLPGTEMRKCGGCIRHYLCSEACRLADQPRHVNQCVGLLAGNKK